MTDVRMPSLSDSMQEGTILTWLVADGAPVAVGQEIVEIETDKATMAYASEAEGVIETVAAVGDTVAVGELIARVGARAATGADGTAKGAEAGPTPTPAPVMAAIDSSGSANDGGAPKLVTPLAGRLAHAHGIDPTGLAGSGPGGRVTKADVLAAAGIDTAGEWAASPSAPPRPARDTPSPAPPRPAQPDPSPAPPASVRIQQPTRLQQVVARRMAQASATVPHFQVQTEVWFDHALALRGQLKTAAGPDAVVPSVNDLIVKACALSLPGHPLVNGSFTAGGFELHDHVHVGIAVASDDGLVVATVRDADIKSLGQIARESRRLAERVRETTATPAELSGATFTVSNLGMYGMTAITAVINPPQAAILGVGAARAVLARGDGGEIVDRQLLTLTLSGDHRILNGADASRFLLEVKDFLESPLRLAL